MSNDSHQRPPAGLSVALARMVVLACYLALGVAVTLIGSSLIHDGHGLLGLSLKVSIAILIPILIAVILLAGRVIWRAMAGQIGGGAETPVGPGAPRQKCEIVTQEWFELLVGAEREFYISGHSLGRWCSASNKKKFSNELKRILAGGGEVTLVMLGARSPQLGPLYQATGTNYSDRIQQSEQALGELRQSLHDDHRERLKVTMLEDHVPIPYMVVGNERRLLTATYLARTDSNSMPCLELATDSEPGRAIYDDFRKLAGEGQGVTTLSTSSTARSSKGVTGRALRRVRRSSR